MVRSPVRSRIGERGDRKMYRDTTSCTLRFCVTAAILLQPYAACTAATITVALDGSGDYTEIRSAIDAAVDGDEVLVAPGEYVVAQPVDFLGKAITVRGESGPEVTTIRVSEAPADPDRASAVVFESGESKASKLEGFTLEGGWGTQYGNETWERGGGGVCCDEGSTPTLRNCTITANWAFFEGGGLFCSPDSSASLTQCTIGGNAAEEGGGVYCREATVTLLNCIVWHNSGEALKVDWPFGVPQDPEVLYSCIETEEV